MKKVTIYGAGNLGSRLAYFLAHSRDISRIRLIDADPYRTKSTVMDFLEANIALRSKMMYVDYEDPVEIELSEVVIVAMNAGSGFDPSVPELADEDVERMEQISGQISHFSPQATVAVLSQPAELLCRVLARGGYLEAKRIMGFPLLTYREYFREEIARVVGLANEDVRISTVRTLSGVELVPAGSAVGGVPLNRLVRDTNGFPNPPDAEAIAKRQRYVHYAPASVAASVASEIVSKRRQVATAIVPAGKNGAYVETKAVIGPNGFEREVELDLSDAQAKAHAAYRERVEEISQKLS